MRKASIILQARMGSTRLPGKVMSDLAGRPMLAFQIERLKRCKNVQEIIIATTTDKGDDVIAQLGNKIGIKVYRGSVNDVLERFYDCIKLTSSAHFIRVTGDCPLIDPKLIYEVIEKYFNGSFDYLSNFEPPSFPDGLDVEIF